MKLSKRERQTLKGPVKRPYGEIVTIAKRYGLNYESLRRWCRDNPYTPTEELARRGPMDPKESGRRGGEKSTRHRKEDADGR